MKNFIPKRANQPKLTNHGLTVHFQIQVDATRSVGDIEKVESIILQKKSQL